MDPGSCICRACSVRCSCLYLAGHVRVGREHKGDSTADPRVARTTQCERADERPDYLNDSDRAQPRKSDQHHYHQRSVSARTRAYAASGCRPENAVPRSRHKCGALPERTSSSIPDFVRLHGPGQSAESGAGNRNQVHRSESAGSQQHQPEHHGTAA